MERTVFTRIKDAVEDAQELLRDNDVIEWMVLDIADATHAIPIQPGEIKYVCTKVGERFFVFEVLCMGSKPSPNIWWRFAAAIGRVIASIFCDGKLRCEVYVDPLLAVSGSRRRKTKLLTMAAFALSVLGFLGLGKVVVGNTVTWIGAHCPCIPRV